LKTQGNDGGFTTSEIAELSGIASNIQSINGVYQKAILWFDFIGAINTARSFVPNLNQPNVIYSWGERFPLNKSEEYTAHTVFPSTHSSPPD
jgi:hypothetical protein